MNHPEVGPKSTQTHIPSYIPLSDLKISLKANCLLTRRPLCFLTPPRSLFFYKNPWLLISSILFEHGYKTEIFQLPFQDIELKKEVLKKNIKILEKKHLIVDRVTFKDLENELRHVHDSTITIISSNNIENTTYFVFQPAEKIPWSLSYQIHQKWSSFLSLQTPNYAETLSLCDKETWHAFLDHCVRLAEIDFDLE